MDAIVTENLTKVYKAQVGKKPQPSLQSLDLTIGQNEVFGFLGRNGAGKTTTIKILCSLLRPTAGRACVLGRDVREREARRAIGYLPENPYFYEYLNPRETLDFYGRLAGLNSRDRAKEWDQISELLDLRDIADQRIRGFSKGMRQRLGFAVALVGDPAVLILDEPMSGLDPTGRRLVRETILLLRERKKTVFFSSHILGDVEQLCDRVGILIQGKLVVQGDLEHLLTRRIDQIEVIVRDLPAGAAKISDMGRFFHRHSEDGDHFVLHDMDEANRLVESAQRMGGKLFAFTPVRESLEDYFIHLQEASDENTRRSA
jgi:ABC-2 type transport system ATP-binding protein